MIFTDPLFLTALLQEAVLVFVTFALALVLGVPLGVLCYRFERLKRPLLGLVDLLQTLPALALFGIVVVVGGRTGTMTTLWLALLYTVLPVIFGTEKGFRGIDRATIDAALGMGLTYRETFVRILLPLASLQIMRSLRKAGVTAVGMITMATLAGGGLGALILDGIRTQDPQMILAGAAPACLLALAVDAALGALQRAVVPAPLRREPERVLFISK